MSVESSFRMTRKGGNADMCKLSDQRNPHNHFASRRDFLKGTAATGAAAAGLSLFAARSAVADDGDLPEGTGKLGRRYVIRGGFLMSVGPEGGGLVPGPLLVRGKKNLPLGPHPSAHRAAG